MLEEHDIYLVGDQTSILHVRKVHFRLPRQSDAILSFPSYPVARKYIAYSISAARRGHSPLLAHWSGVEGKAESRSLRPQYSMQRECASAELRNFESHGRSRYLKGTIDLLLSLTSDIYEGLVSDSKEASITGFRSSVVSFASLTKVCCRRLPKGCV